MRHLFNLQNLKQRRRSLRQQPIPSEARLWMFLRNRQFRGLKFRRQYSIGQYIIDFYCPRLKLVVEIDGLSHLIGDRQSSDSRRQQWLVAHGLRVVRFHSTDIIGNLAGVIAELDREVTRLGWPE